MDVGTDNADLLNDPYYLGCSTSDVARAAVRRVDGRIYGRGPPAFSGGADPAGGFRQPNAFRLLHRYRDQSPVFDDDIQGTAAVCLAGLYSALRITGQPLTEQRILFLGAGEAGIGIGELTARRHGRPGPVHRRRASAAGLWIRAGWW
jgi:malate dehydrogenase (oxaloacetate-decarboxylating)(NADP+)